MDIVSYVNNLARNGFGVWHGVEYSQAVVENPDAWEALPLTPEPTLYYVKFGGDWGGLWGSPDTWRALRAKDARIIPYFYCTPQNVDAYAGLDAQLKQIGYPLTVLDVEFEWQHYEMQLARMLDSLNTDQNPVAFCGLAWFAGYASWEALASTLANYPSVAYLAMAYLSELTNVAKLPQPPGFEAPASSAMEYAQRWLATVVPNQPTGVILDSASLSDTDAISWWSSALAPSIWYADTLTSDAWDALIHVAPPDTAYTFTQQTISDINTNLGQALAWSDTLLTSIGAASAVDLHVQQEQQALVTAIQTAMHTARKLALGE